METQNQIDQLSAAIEAHAADAVRQALERGARRGLAEALPDIVKRLTGVVETVVAQSSVTPMNGHVKDADKPTATKMVAKLAKTDGRRRSPKQMVQLEEAVLAAVSTTPGSRAADLARTVSASMNVELTARDIRDIFVRLVNAARLRSEGVKQGTRYFPVKGKRAQAQAPAAIAA